MDSRRSDSGEVLAGWMVLAGFVAYWWFMARALRGLLRECVALGRWFRGWRAEGTQR